MVTTKQQTLAQSNVAHQLVCVCSSHPLAVQMISDAIASAGEFDVKTRMSTTLYQVEPRAQGELLLLDGCCSNDWPKHALRWQRSGGRVLLLLMAKAADPRQQLRALFLGVKGVVVTSSNWYTEVHSAIRTVLEGRLWVSRDVLNEYVKRTRGRGRNEAETVDSVVQLTAREEQIISLLQSGDSNKEIGETLGIAERTVKYHVSNILQKSQVSSRRELVERMTKDEDRESMSMQHGDCRYKGMQVASKDGRV